MGGVGSCPAARRLLVLPRCVLRARSAPGTPHPGGRLRRRARLTRSLGSRAPGDGCRRHGSAGRLAAGAASGPACVVADGAELPLRAASVDLAVAYNSLMDVDDLSAVVRELGRVVAPGGRLCVCITHPLADAGTLHRPRGARSVRDRGGLPGPPPVRGDVRARWAPHHVQGVVLPLATYSHALESGGFLMEALREPDPAADAPARLDRYRRIPNFLMLRAVKSAPSPADPTHASRPRRAA